MQDSVSHARLCQLLIDLAVGGAPPEMEVGGIIDMSQAIEEHIQVEEQMIKRLELMLAKQLDDKSHLLLSYMLADERRHHNLLKKIMDLTIHKESSY